MCLSLDVIKRLSCHSTRQCRIPLCACHLHTLLHTHPLVAAITHVCLSTLVPTSVTVHVARFLNATFCTRSRSWALSCPAWMRSASRTNETYRTDLFTHRDLILPSIPARLACVCACVRRFCLAVPFDRLSGLSDPELSFINPARDSCQSTTPLPLHSLNPCLTLSLNIIPFSYVLSLLLYSNNSPSSSPFFLPKFSLIFSILFS